VSVEEVKPIEEPEPSVTAGKRPAKQSGHKGKKRRVEASHEDAEEEEDDALEDDGAEAKKSTKTSTPNTPPEPIEDATGFSMMLALVTKTPDIRIRFIEAYQQLKSNKKTQDAMRMQEVNPDNVLKQSFCNFIPDIKMVASREVQYTDFLLTGEDVLSVQRCK
jgi:hypothetical protein